AILQFGDNLPQVEKYLNLEGQAWERLILLREAEKRRLSVSDQLVIDTIQKAVYFQKKGVFDDRTYNEILRYVFRLPPRTFEEQLRQNLILAKLYSQITDNVKIDAAQIRQEWLKINEEISIYYIASLYAEFAKKIKPSDKEIGAYYDKNKETFKELPGADKTKKPGRILELSEVKDKIKEILIKEESVKIAQSKINECVEKLKTQPFNQVSGSSSKIGLKTGQTKFFKSTDKLDILGPGQIFWDAAKKSKENQASDMFSDNQGYYIVKLKATQPVDEAKFAKEKNELGENLLNQEKNKVFAKFTEEIKKKAQK
ncbi:MAG: SurA N-terminal domain-containing protein, partial [Candidatus Omnitrophica bacterium]|nr:SurA N-terminal domain-containing protein [Candidatus Omnitrophota bacterium]